jgi:hypothetical protein
MLGRGTTNVGGSDKISSMLGRGTNVGGSDKISNMLGAKQSSKSKEDNEAKIKRMLGK